MIPTGGNPREVDIEPDGNGSVLKSLQTAVNGICTEISSRSASIGGPERIGTSPTPKQPK